MILDEGRFFDHQKGHVKKTKSILDNDIITNNDNEWEANGSISRSTVPLSSPSSISSVRPSSNLSPIKKVRMLSDLYLRCQNQPPQEDKMGEINSTSLAKDDFK